MASIKQEVTLKHTASLGSDVEDVAFEAGDEITVLKEWADSYLIKNEDGQIFNIGKDFVEAD